MIKNLKLMMAVAVFALAIGNARAEDFHGGPLTAEEKALKRKGDVMEVYQPSDHSGYRIDWIKPSGSKGKGVKVLICNFGMEHVQKARAQGREMRSFNYTPAMAEQFLFAQAWSASQDRFYTRAYVQEGMAGYYGN